jgi:Ca2+-binding RTX toxin-like protein
MVRKLGTSGNDTLNGTAKADTLFGLDGNDKISGLAGDDQLIGDAGKDRLYGGAGNDILFGVAGGDLLDGGDGSDTAYYLSNVATTGVTVSLLKHKGSGGEAAGDKLVNIENIQGSNFADVLTGDAGANLLEGAGGNDKLSGGDGNDVLAGGAGGDRLDGGAGRDIVSYESRTAKKAVHADLLHHVFKGGDAQGDKLFNIEDLNGTKFADFLQGDGGKNSLNGEAGNDTIYGGGGDDLLVGGAGNDFLSDFGAAPGGVVTFRPGTGIDKIVGNGNDTLDYSDMQAGVSFDLGAGTAGGAANGDTFTGILNAFGSNFNDNLKSGLASHADISGQGGNDVITVAGAFDRAFGDSGDDAITLDGVSQSGFGGGDSDTIVVNGANGIGRGGNGDDTVVLRGANQQGHGDAGNDTIDGALATSGAQLFGGAGDDKLFGGNGSDTFVGGDGNDLLKDNNTSLGNAAEVDVFAPGAGSDTVTGDGNDAIDYFDAASGVVLNLGLQTAGGFAAGDTYSGILNANGGGFGDTLTSGTLGLAILQGHGGGDTLTLKGAFDQAFGGDGSDTIVFQGRSERGEGGAGDDILDARGATGTVVLDRAVLTGGAGNDTLIASTTQRVVFVAEYDKGSDTFTNFSRSLGDKIGVHAPEFGMAGVAGTALDPSNLVNVVTVVANAARPQFIFDTVNQDLWFDKDGTGTTLAPVKIAHFTELPVGVTTLAAADFLFL